MWSLPLAAPPGLSMKIAIDDIKASPKQLSYVEEV